MEYSLRYLSLAYQDVEDIDEYLSMFYPGTAGRFFAELGEKLERLKTTPNMGAPEQGYRRLVVERYLVYYRVNDDERTIDIHRIIRGAFDLRHLMEWEKDSTHRNEK